MTFSAQYSYAYSALQIFAEALSVFQKGILQFPYINVHLFNCYMNDYLYTYLFANDINCELKLVGGSSLVSVSIQNVLSGYDLTNNT